MYKNWSLSGKSAAFSTASTGIQAEAGVQTEAGLREQETEAGGTEIRDLGRCERRPNSRI